MSFQNTALSPMAAHCLTCPRGDATAWNVPKGYELRRTSIPGTASLAGEITSTAISDEEKQGNAWADQGVSVELAQEYAEVFNGQTVEIILEARSSGPSAGLQSLFTTRQSGNSGWQEFGLSDEFSYYTFQTKIRRKSKVGDRSPLILIRPTKSGEAGRIQVRSVAARLVRQK